jgi:hypothetical protein
MFYEQWRKFETNKHFKWAEEFKDITEQGTDKKISQRENEKYILLEKERYI